MAGLSREGCRRSRMEDGLCVNELDQRKKLRPSKAVAVSVRPPPCSRFFLRVCKIRVEQNRQGNYLKLGQR